MTHEEKMIYTYFIRTNDYLDDRQKETVRLLKSKYPLDEKHIELINYSVYMQNKSELINSTKILIDDSIANIYRLLDSLGCLTDDNSIQSIFNNPHLGAMNIKILPILNNQLEILLELKKDIANGKNLKVNNIDKLIEKYSSKGINKDFLSKLGKQSKRKNPTILALLLIDELVKIKGVQSKSNPIKKDIKSFIEKLFEIKLRDEDFTKYKNKAILSLSSPYIYHYKKN